MMAKWYALIVALLLFTGCKTSDVRNGNLCIEMGDYRAAIRFFSHILESDPSHFDARLGMGRALLQKTYDNPDDTTAWQEAVMHIEAARMKQSSKELHHLLSQVWAERSRFYLYKKDTLQALEMLTRSLGYDPHSTEALNLAGIIYVKTGNNRKARLLFEHALSIDSTNTTLLFNIGMLDWEANDFSHAHDWWLCALQHAPDDRDILYWFAAAEKELRSRERTGSPPGSAVP